ncbi:MAG: hypothetical protein FJ138_10815 [Deltaproteobacteria bacterium]|nr:hypothetical protein [Deltaproteobacteria bacterium]
MEALAALIPAAGAARDAYVSKACLVSGLLAADEGACEAAVASCADDINNLDVAAAAAECAQGEIFNTCAAPAAEVAACQVAQAGFYAGLVQRINTALLSCASAGDIFVLSAALAPLGQMPPADLCTPAASACLAR